MSYSDELVKIARKPVTIVILTLDYCDLTFSVAPCTATGTGNQKCYNTRKTCYDTDNYISSTGKDYKFCMNGAPLPVEGDNLRPYLCKDPSYLPTEIDVKKSLTINARVTYEFYDEPDNDIGVDPYVSERTWYPDAPGTFWRKLLARNPYYEGRMITEISGHFGFMEPAWVWDGGVPVETLPPVVMEDFKVRRFIIDQIDIGSDGTVKVIGKDPLKLADKTEIPAASPAKVTDNPLTAVAATVNCDDTSEYTSSGYIRIEDEIIVYTGTTATSFTGCTRGQFSTTAAQHSQDSKIQQCYVKTSVNGVDICRDIIDRVGINETYVDSAGFISERDQWYSAYTFSCVISKPTKAADLLTQLQEQMVANIWWDEDEQLVKYKAFAPPSAEAEDTTAELTEDDLVDITIDSNEISRISRLVIYYNKTALGDLEKPESYANAYIAWDVDAESADLYNQKAIKTIYSQFITTSVVAAALHGTYLRRFKDPAKIINIGVDLKDSEIKTADIIELTTDMILDRHGVPLSLRRYQVSKRQQKSASKYNYTLIDSGWTKNYGFIAPGGQPDWDAASAAEKEYAYIGDADNLLGAANDEGFYIF